jgi:thiosulfate dehydrogenase [quinone] large subunit
MQRTTTADRRAVRPAPGGDGDRPWLRLGPPPRAHRLAGWALLPLRLFLGFTFTFAGLQKLANPTFFDFNSPSGIHAQLIAAERGSPIHLLLGHLLRFSTPLGVLIALGEVAVGLGVLLGLWTRLAALGGMAISFSLFLTVSFHASPYYTGSDIAFFFAFLPLVVAGAGGVLSVDLVIASRVAREDGQPSPSPVPVTFGFVQEHCGHYDQGRCTARRGADCEQGHCPVLTKDPAARVVSDDRRRALVLGGAAAAGLAVVGGVLTGAVVAAGRLVGGAKVPSGSQAATLGPTPSGGSGTTVPPSSTTTAPPSAGTTTTPVHTPSGTKLGPAKDVPVGGWARFTDPANGGPAIAIQEQAGKFTAFDAVCPHAECTVGYAPSAKLIVCPCHGSEFDPQTGAVLVGPATTGLTPLTLTEGSNGDLYVS